MSWEIAVKNGGNIVLTANGKRQELLVGEDVNLNRTLAVDCDGKSITTVEGLKDQKTGELDPIQQASIDNAVFHCGFCISGITMSARALLNRNPDLTEEDVKEALAGHYCKCISHHEVIKAVTSAAGKRRLT